MDYLKTNNKSDFPIEEEKQIIDEIVMDDDECGVSSNTDKTVGVVGIDLIGSGIIKKFIESGLTVFIYNTTIAKCIQLHEELAKTDKLTYLLSAREVLKRSDYVFVCVSDDEATKNTIYYEFGADLDYEGILENKGIVVITSSTSAVCSARMYEKVVKKNGTYLELAPQGSKHDLRDGKLVLITAGDESLFHRCQLYFKIIGMKSFYLGKIGFAIKVNFILQKIKEVNLRILVKGISLAEELGVPADAFVEIFNETNATSNFLKNETKAIIKKK